MTRAVLASAIVLTALSTPALAYQTEVDQGTMQWKREGRARWNHEHKREMEREQRQAAVAVAASVADVEGVSEPPAAGCLSAGAVASYARQAGFPEEVVPTMVSIAARESGLCPGAVNSSSGACGLWQLYPCPGEWALTPAGNAAGAYAKYQASGLSPWGYG